MSRISGEVFEYIVTRFLKETYNLSFYDSYSAAKYKKWQSKFTYEEPKMPFIDEFVSYNKIRLCLDTDGCNGNSSDIELHNDLEWVPISLKNNNISIKHPRCNSMHNHMSESFQQTYIDKYNKINDKYFLLAESKGYTKFTDYSGAEKKQMYSELKGVLMNMCRKSPISCKKIFEFCIGICHTKQIIIKQSKKQIECLKYKPINLQKVKITDISYNTFCINISGIDLKFRIHSASSRITSKLSMKYDVTPVNIDDLFELIENDY